MDSLVVVEIMVLVSTVLYTSLILRGRRQKPRGGGQEKTEGHSRLRFFSLPYPPIFLPTHGLGWFFFFLCVLTHSFASLSVLAPRSLMYKGNDAFIFSQYDIELTVNFMYSWFFLPFLSFISFSFFAFYYLLYNFQFQCYVRAFRWNVISILNGTWERNDSNREN